MIGAALGLESLAKRRARGPAVVTPGAPAACARISAIAVRCTLNRRQIRIFSTRQSGVIPVAAPLANIAVHIVQTPRIGRIAADFGCSLERRSGARPVVRLAGKIG